MFILCLVITREYWLNLWGSDMAAIEAKDVVPLAKGAQVLQLVKDNQLITAVIVFILWQAGAVAEALAFAGCS